MFDILTAILPKEIYPVIVFGILYFLLIFGGSNRWKEYRNIEIGIFSAASGLVVLFFFVIPISFFLIKLKVFQDELVITINDFFQHSDVFLIMFVVVFAYLIIWKLKSNKPLCDYGYFKDFTQLSIIRFTCVLALVDLAFFVAFSFSTYEEQLRYIMVSFFLLILFGVSLYLIFLKTVLELPIDNENLSVYLRRGLFSKFISENKKWIISILLIIFISSALTGLYLFKTTVGPAENDKQTGLEIPIIDTKWSSNRNLDGYFIVEKNYTITFGLIPWTKFKPDNISLMDKHGDPYYISPNYRLSGEYVIIKNSRRNTINVIIKGKNYDNALPKIYNISKKEFNETVQIWNVNFTTPYDFDIKIDDFVIAKDKQLKLIDHKMNNIPAFNIKFNEEPDNIFISEVELKKHEQNQSITLIFNKTYA